MSLSLFTDELSSIYDESHRKMLVSNFTEIMNVFNGITDTQQTILKQQDIISKKQDEIISDNQLKSENIEKIVSALSNYDVPISIVNGAVIINEEGN